MHPSNAEHLTPEQILQAANGRLDDPQCLAHLNVCPECSRSTGEWRLWLKSSLAELEDAGAVTTPPESGQCLTPGEIAALLFAPAGDRVSSGLAHTAGCVRCGRLLRSAMDRPEADAEEREFIAGLRTTSPEWQRRTAGRYSIPVVPPAVAGSPKVHWLAVAAAVILSAGLAAWWVVSRSPERLLAQAYRDSRPFEYRLPDAGFAPVRKKQSGGSSAFDKPEALTRAIEEIQRRLAAGKVSSADWFLKGRAELQESQYGAAIESLMKGLAMQPKDTEALTDLGVAYALEGDAENRDSDYCHAIDLFQQSLNIDSRQPRALYNSALVFEKLWLVNQAVDAWTRYLAVEKNADWLGDAKDRLKKLTAIQNRKTEMMKMPRDARSFLALLRKSPGAVEPELYLDDFWAKWLPQIRNDADVRAGAEELGRVFVERFHDDSVRDAVSDAIAVDATTELRALSQVLTDSFEERNDVATAEGRQLLPMLAAKRQSAARDRAVLELGYTYGKAPDHESCLRLLDREIDAPEMRRYPWLAGQLHLQHSSCMVGTAETSVAWAEADRVRSFAEKEGFRYLTLKALAAADTLAQVGGNFAAVWETAPTGLQTYWLSGASHFRAQQFIHDMQVAAAGMGWKESAIALGKASVQALDLATMSSQNKILVAINRSILAGLLQDAGHYRDALAELGAAGGLFAKAEPGRTLENSKRDAILERATIQAAGPSAADAREALSELNGLPDSLGARESMRALQAKGLAQRSIGSNDDAEKSFQGVVDRHHSYLIGASAAQIVAADALVRESYRNLAELQLVNDGKRDLALATWDSYRDPAGGGRMVPAPPPGSIVLIYAVLPSGVAAWIRTADGIDGRMIPVSASEIEGTARAFARLASNPSSDIAELHADSHRLFQWLLGPFKDRIPARAKLCVEADDWLASIPFGALVDDSGRYEAAEHPITMISSIHEATSDAASAFHATDSALIVSAAAPKSPAGEDLPVLDEAREEAADLRQRMPGSVLLSDAAASPESIAREMKTSTLFHFAGHGWANGGNGALLLAPGRDTADTGKPEESVPSWIDAGGLAKQKWGRCRLAVLSACLTAAGEERGPVNNRSLVRALLAAGAKRVVAARWSVDASATKEVMRRFYDGLFAGASPAEALATAETGVSVMKGWSHPYYWAGFDVFGSQ